MNKNRSILLALGLLAPLFAQATTLVNPDFEAEAGAWSDRDGPPGWELRLDDDDQLGIVEEIDFAHSGSHAFFFSHLQSGFGGSRMDQCVVLGDEQAIGVSVAVLTDEPHPELSARLRMDFFADEACDEDSADADAEQVQSDIGLSAERVPAGEWTRLHSEARLRSELGEDVRSVRVSLRVRDRSDDGQPRDPARIVWLDDVSLQADITLLPESQQQALRELHEATGGEHWHRQVGWMNAVGSECRWHGVTCDESGKTVIALDLAGNGLTGTLPESITELVDLRTGSGLDLCHNALDIPDTLTEWADARQIGGDLADCQHTNLAATSSRMGGHFFQPEGRDGEGMMVHMLSEGSALFYWATYDDQGEPLWMIATGRAHERVVRFDDLYRTAMGEDGLELESIGQARLVFPEAEPACSRALMRFHVDAPGFGASDQRDLVYVDGMGGCQRPEEQDPLFIELEGQWYDPEFNGQGISLAPYSDDRVVLTWYTYREDGTQTWRWGVGERNGDTIDFGEIVEFFGGDFNGAIDPSMLTTEPVGTASVHLETNGNGEEQWHFTHEAYDEPDTSLALERIVAGPGLMASTGQPLYLDMAWDDVEELYMRDVRSDERLPGRVRFGHDSEPEDLMGLRFRGSSSRFLPKKAFNIRFERPQDLLHESERMNLNAMYTDPSMMREKLSFRLWHELGQPASRTRYFDFWLNDIYEGLHIHIQRVDEWLLTMNGLNPDGTLVRDGFRDNDDLADSAFGHDYGDLDDQQREDLLAENFNYRGDPEWGRVRELIDWVQATPAGGQFAQGFAERIDVDNFIDWLVLHWLVGDIDSFGDDYWLYLDHDDPGARWIFIPWDKDLSFGSHFRQGFFTDNDFFNYESTLSGGWGNMLISRFLSTPSLRQQADARLAELIGERFPESWFGDRIDEYAELIADSVGIDPSPVAFKLHDQNHHGELGRFADHVENLKDFIELRYRFIEHQLNGATGEANHAEATVDAGHEGRIYLVDGEGFTLAWIDPVEPLLQDTGLVLAVEESPSTTGIDRIWTLESSAPLGEVSVTLFYRNDLPYTGRDNWWTGGDEAIGQQNAMLMRIVQGDGPHDHLDTRVNAYSNKATATVEVDQGSMQLQLVLLPTLSP
jgi:spore coat protein H